jgi:hypothetical protein
MVRNAQVYSDTWQGSFPLMGFAHDLEFRNRRVDQAEI